MKNSLPLILATSLTFACGLAGAHAADMPLKAKPVVASPSWTGFYIGGHVGGAFADRSMGYAGNDAAGQALITGFDPGTGAPVAQEPVRPHGVNLSDVTGGVTAGYNWQVSPSWVLGLETDFSGANVRGSGSGTSTLITVGAIAVPQTITSDQRIDWWGTVRARAGVLATPDVLLFGTAGFAYGNVSASSRYGISAPGPANYSLQYNDGSSFSCTENTTCFAGSQSGVRTGWTAGAGGEWRFARHWTAKLEYLYVDLGRTRVRSTALVAAPGFGLSSYTADFGRTDMHVFRGGVNYQF